MSDLGKAAQARRFYHHVLNGGKLTPENVSLMVQTIEELEAENARLVVEKNRAIADSLEADLMREKEKRRAEAASAPMFS